jgi:putative hemolysin
VQTSFAIIAVLLTCSAFFSGTEVAMFGLRRVDREQMARSGRRTDQLILSMLSRPRQLIATLLVGNESVNISMSAVMAGTTPQLFAGRSEAELAILATAMALPLVLLFGEITPKTIAYKNQPVWARAAARPLRLFQLLVTPVRLVVVGVASVLLRPLGATGRAPPRALSEAEFRALVDAGNAEGEVDARERHLIHKVFEFGDKTVAEAMVPRDQVFALSYDLPQARLTHEVAGRSFSRVPIYQKSLDNVRGVLHVKDLLIQSAAAPAKLSQILHEPLFVPQTTPLERLFRQFKQRKIHMALVVNEYGKLAGLVTMDDLLQQLFGDVHLEREHRRAEKARQLAASPEESAR